MKKLVFALSFILLAGGSGLCAANAVPAHADNGSAAATAAPVNYQVGTLAPPSGRVKMQAVRPTRMSLAEPVGSLKTVECFFNRSRILYYLLYIIGPVLLALICLIDILRNTFAGSDKAVWLLAVVLLPYIGPVLYLLIRPEKKKAGVIPDELQY